MLANRFHLSTVVFCGFVGLFSTVGVISSTAQNLFTNPSFETGTWGGTFDYIDPDNSTQLFSSPQILPGWTHMGDTFWIDDASRAAAGTRFVAHEPTKGEVVIAQTLPVFTSGNAQTSLIGLQDYTLGLNYAFFDRGDPDATNPMFSTIEVFALLVETGFPPDPFTEFLIYSNSGSVSPWEATGGGSGIDWYNATINFTMPDVAGYDAIKFYFRAPLDEVSNPSRGILLDNVSLTAVVPEPGGALLLCAAAMGWLTGHRRRTSRLA